MSDLNPGKTLPFPLEAHTKACLAEALISAVQNLRDDRDTKLHHFKSAMTNGSLLATADGYLKDGLQTCTCRVGAFAAVRDRYAVALEEETDEELLADYGIAPNGKPVDYAQASARHLAECELRNTAFSPEDFMQVVGMIDRHDWPFNRTSADSTN